MTAVFIAGSRAISRLNAQITERLDNIINRRLSVLVGDANGADKAVQQYFAKCGYRNVTVHCMDACRNNVGDWPIRRHTAPSSVRRDRHYYAIKDVAMASDATCGFMLWDGHSKGTLANILNLINTQKKVLLYVRPSRKFVTLARFDELRNVLQALGIQDVDRFLGTMGMGDIKALPLAGLG